MNIDDKILDKLEKLSSIKVPDDKREAMKSDLSKIVNFVEVLNELDLDDAQATVSTTLGGTRLRDDEPYENPQIIKDIIKHAPKSSGQYFEVPKIIE